jgi:glycosyltransferase involved in cell wall biosynthesis
MNASIDHFPKVSVIVPTYNEIVDVTKCLDSLLSLDYENVEIIFVDSNSTDGTREFLEEKAKEGKIKLIKEEKRKGVSSARNLGVISASGEILIVLNADVILPNDFIKKVLPHYWDGAGFVICDSHVENQEHLFPRWIQSKHVFQYSNDESIVWSEGFSCLKSALMDVGLFPTGFVSNTSGEDAIFGESLEKEYKKVIDRSIVVKHFAPVRLKEIFRQRFGRGRGTPYLYKYAKSLKLREIFKFLVGETLLEILFLMTFVVFLIEAWKVSGKSERSRRDFIPFFFIEYFDSIFQVIGEWDAFFELYKNV